MKKFLISCSVLALISCGASAEIYKWKDASGKIGYGNVPPSSVDYIEFSARTPKPVTNDIPAKEINNLPSADEREKKIAEDLENETKKAAQNCEKSKDSLKLLESGERVVRYNAKGEKEVLDDKARTVEMTNAKRAISEWCPSE